MRESPGEVSLTGRVFEEKVSVRDQRKGRDSEGGDRALKTDQNSRLKVPELVTELTDDTQRILDEGDDDEEP